VATLISMPQAPPVRAPHRRRAIRWVFLDRDGTLNVKPPEGEYVERPEALRLLPGAAEAVRMLNRAGIWTGVVTNQRGIALGRMSIENLAAVHERLMYLLRERGAFVDAIYACPHGLDACDCRKPGPGLLLKAQSEHPALDFADAAIVGDSPSDVQAGRRLGLRTVLISSGPDDEHEAEIADHRVSDLLQAVSILLKMGPRAGAHTEPASEV
jgi:D-glycero-D-manno-heptose 1,7-bisphosphate phosphatase